MGEPVSTIQTSTENLYDRKRLQTSDQQRSTRIVKGWKTEHSLDELAVPLPDSFDTAYKRVKYTFIHGLRGALPC